MDIEKLFEKLSFGPLSNLAISNQGDGTIVANKQAMIVQFANEALLRLYSRFILSEKEVIVEQREDITSYKLSSEYAVSNLDTDPDTIDYIKDSEEAPFQNDVLQIISVYDHGGCKLPMNDMSQCNSVFTPNPTTVQVPKPVQGVPIHIIYQAQHPELSADDLTTEIKLPTVLEEALEAYVASKVFNHMNGQEHRIKAQDHLAMYESVCTQVEKFSSVRVDDEPDNHKFYNRGFV